MALQVGGSNFTSPVTSIIETNKQRAEQAVTSIIKETIDDPTKNIREMQQPSPLGQFLDIKL